MKHKILNAAFTLFVEKGYTTSMSDIAYSVGIKKQSIYYHYENKESLFSQLICEKIQDFYNYADHILETLAHDPLEEQLHGVFSMTLEYFGDINRLKFWKRLFLIEDAEMLDKVKDFYRKQDYNYSKKLKKIIDAWLLELDDSSKESVLETYMILLHGSLDGLLLFHGLDNAPFFQEHVWEFFVNGVKSAKDFTGQQNY